MDYVGSGALLDVNPVNPVATDSPKWNVNKPIQAVLAAACLGDHGDEFRYEKPTPAAFTAVLNCGHQTQYPMPPITGELLYCRVHDDWYKCRVVGGYVLKCNSCEYTLGGLGHNSTVAYRKASCHSIGSRGQRKVKHEVMVGRYTVDSIDWKLFALRSKGK